jgi:photosystem II stability/assembly factor-like uncharacterized protein
MKNASLAAAAFCLIAGAAVGAEPGKPGDWQRRLVTSGQGYFPVVHRLSDGRIAIVLRGGAGHLGIKGRLDLVLSDDEGKTWTKPVVVVDTPLDDRNPAFGQAADGTLVVGFLQLGLYDDEGRYDVNLDRPVNGLVTRSTDGGSTWSEPVAIGVEDIQGASPFGRMVLMPDRSLLMAIYGEAVHPPGNRPPYAKRTDHSYVYRSTDSGQTWSRIAEIGDGKQQLNETALLRLPSGKLVAAIRSRSTQTWMSQSDDDGRTWTTPRQITPSGVHPGDLCALPDGRLLLTVGDRESGYGVRGMIARAGQPFDWEERFTLVDDAVSKDCGYPSSVVLGDGRVLTAYYATRCREQPEWGVHCGAVTFRPPGGR